MVHTNIGIQPIGSSELSINLTDFVLFTFNTFSYVPLAIANSQDDGNDTCNGCNNRCYGAYGFHIE